MVKLNGYRRAWNENGILIGERLYENGVAIGSQKRWYDNGNLKSEA